MFLVTTFFDIHSTFCQVIAHAWTITFVGGVKDIPLPQQKVIHSSLKCNHQLCLIKGG